MIEMQPLFVVPSWRICYDNHSKNKTNFVTHLKKYKEKNISLRNNLSIGSFITNQTMHLDPMFEDFIKFAMDIAADVRTQYNFAPSVNLGLKSMYGSITDPSGIYHNEFEGDSLISGIYFLNTPPNSGAVMLNHNVGDSSYYKNAWVESKNLLNTNNTMYPMAEGEILLYPSHLKVYTTPNLDTVSRFLIHFTFKII